MTSLLAGPAFHDESEPPAGSMLIYDEDGVKIFDQTTP
jgi:hypothetical protein